MKKALALVIFATIFLGIGFFLFAESKKIAKFKDVAIIQEETLSPSTPAEPELEDDLSQGLSDDFSLEEIAKELDNTLILEEDFSDL